MKLTTMYAFIWFATAIAVSVAIIVTGKVTPLWAMFIPALMRASSD